MQSERLVRTDFTELYEPLKLRGKADDTKRQYRYALDKLAEYLGHEATRADMTNATVSDLLGWMADNGYAARSINNCRAYLLALWRFLARKRLVDEWPDVEMQPEPEIIPMAWTTAQLETLFASCAAETGLIGGVPAQGFWLGLHFVWFDTGERFTATMRTRWDGLDFSTGYLSVPATVRKGGKKAMLYRLQSDTLEVLQTIQLPKRDLIFPWDRTPSTFYHHYTRILKRAGLPYDRYSKAQRMRRSFATHLEANGGNATEAMRHAARRTTEKSYLDMRIIRKRAPSDLLPRPCGNELLKDMLRRAEPCPIQKNAKPAPKRNAKGA